jgi:hypothetical protein
MRMAGLPQTSLIATSSRGRTVLLLMTINPDGSSIMRRHGQEFMPCSNGGQNKEGEASLFFT